MRNDNCSRWLLITTLPGLLCLSLFGWGKILPVYAASAEAGSVDASPGQRIGAPQVLEIPSQPVEPASQEPQRTEPPVVYDESAGFPESQGQGSVTEQREPPLPQGIGRRNYLGVLYASAEEGPVGVKVLDVVPDSPAERAGFQSVNHPQNEGKSKLIKAAIVILAMSPAGPFAIPLAIAHDMYTNRGSPGDLIVAVSGQPVRDAQEFSEIMHRYQPHEVVVFSIVRQGKPMEISVQLEEEPLYDGDSTTLSSPER